MVGRIIGIIISLILIIGGLSGKLVLRGTDSGMALAIVGALFLIWDIYKIVKDSKRNDDDYTPIDNA